MNDTFDPSKYAACLEYIEGYWEKITYQQPKDDGTLIGLPRPYLRPNNEMFRELYYWDSYFMALGLEDSPRESLTIDITENLLYLMDRFGRIPNSSRFYHLSRSQPPFLTTLVLDSYRLLLRGGTSEVDARTWLARAYEISRREYMEVWRGKKFPDHREVHRCLSRYYDIDIWHNAAEAESGWDMTPRFQDHCLDYIPIDLNCLLFKYELDFIWMADLLGLTEDARTWRMHAEERRRRVSDMMWDDRMGYFFDFDYRHERRSKFLSIAGFFSMWSGLATAEQAEHMVKGQLPFFETPFGVITTEEWSPKEGEVKRQWAWPNGWAPLHWIVVSGLAKYGYVDDARRIATKWVDLVNDIFASTGVNYEKYDVVHGCRAVSDRYPDQKGFGWTNAIFVRFVRFLSTGTL